MDDPCNFIALDMRDNARAIGARRRIKPHNYGPSLTIAVLLAALALFAIGGRMVQRPAHATALLTVPL